MTSKPLSKIPASKAFEALREPVARYPRPGAGAHRLHPLPIVDHETKFDMRVADRVFAIGSCFAREIERALTRAGLDVLSKDLAEFAPDMVSDEFRYLRNKYTSKSIVQDLVWAFEGVSDERLQETYVRSPGDDLWVNYSFGGGHAHVAAPLDVVLKAHRAFLGQLKLAMGADVLVITLGLVEAWFDKRAGVYANVAPRRAIVEMDPERYELHVLSYDQILEDLEQAYRLFRKYATVEQKFLVTVSPVPLHASFRGQDVLQANCYSKSVLRAAVEGFVQGKSDVAYFPSYEIVTLADRKLAFLGNNGRGGKDWRHVNRRMIDHIMWSVLCAYLPIEQLVRLDGLPPREYVSALVSARKYGFVIEFYRAVESREFSEIYIPYYAGVAFLETGQLVEAEKCLERALRIKPAHVYAHVHMARVQNEKGDGAQAKEWVERALSLDPENGAAKALAEQLRA